MPPYSQIPQPPSPKRLAITGSPQQNAIWDCIRSDTCHIVVNAGAGTGKTTTSIEGLYHLPQFNSNGQPLNAAVLAFNKPIAVELQTKVPSFAKAGTFHSLCYGAVRNQWPFLGTQPPNTDRTWQMLPDNMPGTTKRLITRLTSICKGQLCDGTNRQELMDLCVQYDIDLYGDGAGGGDLEDVVFSYVPQILERSRTPTPASGIDFDDMIWLTVIWNLPVKKYDFLIVDESQDLNRIQQELLFQLVRPKTGRIMVVGDRRQAIYAFRGARSRSMDELLERLSYTQQGVKEFPLTVTRRCPVLVVALARQIVPDFDYAW